MPIHRIATPYPKAAPQSKVHKKWVHQGLDPMNLTAANHGNAPLVGADAVLNWLQQLP